MRSLSLTGTSGCEIKSVRARADKLGLDYGHFRGQRRWSDDDLREAVAQESSWPDVAMRLGLCGGSAVATLKGHAARLRVDAAHLVQDPPPLEDVHEAPDLTNLCRAGSMLGAAWLTLCGYDVSWPLEPCCYDLMAQRAGNILRVQVKTTRLRVGDSWKVSLSTGGSEHRTYDPDQIDYFFIVDGDLSYYLIPVAAVGGLKAIHLSNYSGFRVSERQTGIGVGSGARSPG